MRALGGDIIYDPEHMEVGTYDLCLTDDGRTDELFNHLPDTFRAQLGRKDRASQLPENVLHLASSANAPYQAFRVPGRPIWATQFHPELTRATNLARFRRYMNGYAAVLSPEAVQTTLDRFDHSPEANRLLRHFITIVFG